MNIGDIGKILASFLVLLLGLIGISAIEGLQSTEKVDRKIGSGRAITLSSFNIASPGAIGYAVPVIDGPKVGDKTVTFVRDEKREHTRKRLDKITEHIKELMKKSSLIALQEARPQYYNPAKYGLLQGSWSSTNNVNGCVILYNKDLYEPITLNYDVVSNFIKVNENLIKLVGVRYKSDTKKLFIFNVHMLGGRPDVRKKLVEFLVDFADKRDRSVICVGDFNSYASDYANLEAQYGIKMHGSQISSYSRFDYTATPEDDRNVGYGTWKRKQKPYHPIDLAMTYKINLVSEIQIPNTETFTSNETPYKNTEGLQTQPNYGAWGSDHAAKIWKFEIV